MTDTYTDAQIDEARTLVTEYRALHLRVPAPPSKVKKVAGRILSGLFYAVLSVAILAALVLIAVASFAVFNTPFIFLGCLLLLGGITAVLTREALKFPVIF